MSPRHFSKPYGPYFVGQTFSQHKEHEDDLREKGLAIVPIIGRVVSLVKSLRKKAKD